MRKLLPLLLLPLIFIACTTDAKRMEMQTDAMLEFMDASGLDFTATGTGLYDHIEKEGDLSRSPDSSHLVSFKHVGYLIDSSVFSNGWYASGFYPLPGLVQGFQEGLKIVGEGGRAVVVFPSNLGYGEDGASTVPAWSPLIFRLELVSYY